MTPSRPRRVVAALAVLAVVLLLAPGAVLAHAELDTATPADKATVPPPTEVVMTFTENLDPTKSSIKLADAGGQIVAEGSSVDSGNTKTMRLIVPDLAAGAYTVRWISASAEDGDLDHGTTSFTVTAPSAAPSVAPSAGASAAPSTAPSASPTAAPSVAPSPSAPPAAPASSTSDAIIPIVVVLIVLAGLGLWLLRGRGRGSTAG